MAVPGLPGDVWAGPVLLVLLVAGSIPGSEGLECGQGQYEFHQRCCSDCAPGQRMRRRCTPRADTECSPCQDGYFSPRPHHGFCQSCTVCHTWTGSVEVKACDKTSDTVCVCRPGFQPEGSSAGSECSPCPEGTFSRGGNDNCRPWTNCSSFGKSRVRAGTATEDSECNNNSPLPTEFLEKRDPIPTEFLEKKDPIPTKFPEKRDPIPTKFPEKRDLIPTEFLEKRDPIPTEFPEKRDPIPTEFSRNDSKGSPGMCRDPGGSAQPAWGSLSLLLLCLVLLVVSGVSILLLILQSARKKPRDGSGRGLQHKNSNCRVPIQEEQLDPNCSLVKI